MEAKMLVFATYNKESYLSRLQESMWFPDRNNNPLGLSFSELVVIPLVGLSIIYVLYLIIRCIYLNVQTYRDKTIYNREYCPICLSEFTAPIRANCGHAFCIECLHSYITDYTGDLNCPLCRNSIRDFECLNKFTLEDKEQAHERQLEEELRNYIQENINKVTVLPNIHVISIGIFTYYVAMLFIVLYFEKK